MTLTTLAREFSRAMPPGLDLPAAANTADSTPVSAPLSEAAPDKPPAKLKVNANGVAEHALVRQQTASGQATISPAIERGVMNNVRGIIVHQTDSPTAAATLNGYKVTGANGAHFLIDKDGTIYQTASLNRQTWHVGKLKSRCMAENRCTPAETRLNQQRFDPSAEHAREARKAAGQRYPSNQDAIGIELVGQAFPRGSNNATYEAVSAEQNTALRWLVGQLKAEYGVADTEVFRHPQASRKNETEASTAQW